MAATALDDEGVEGEAEAEGNVKRSSFGVERSDESGPVDRGRDGGTEEDAFCLPEMTAAYKGH